MARLLLTSIVVLVGFIRRCDADSQIECKILPSAEVCEGHGICKDDYCYCEAGRLGPYCQILTCPHSCGDGVCGPDQKCVCSEGVKGERCDMPSGGDDLVCGEHGDPFPDVGSPAKDDLTVVKYKCFCDPAWVGDKCDQLLCPFDDGKMCGDRGNCVNGECICRPQFTGPTCKESACKSGCSGHGECLSADLCRCEEDYYGLMCEKKYCPGQCNNHGDCQDNGECVCDPGWSTESCAIENCPLNCNHDLRWGECIDFKSCQCVEGMSGNDCSINMTDTSSLGGFGSGSGSQGDLDEDQPYDPCNDSCLDRCNTTCSGGGPQSIYMLQPGRMLRAQLPYEPTEQTKICLKKCEEDCTANCLSKVTKASSAGRAEITPQLPSLQGIDTQMPLKGKWAKPILEMATNVSGVSFGEHDR